METIPSEDCESTFMVMQRDVVRMAFRILDTGNGTEQSSTHVSTFAVFDVSFWLMCFPILLSDLIFNVKKFLRILLIDLIFHVVYVLFSLCLLA